MMKITRCLAAAGVMCVGALFGCDHSKVKGEGPPVAPVARGPVPAYAQVAGVYNARVRRLERLACPVGVVVHGRDDRGNALREQVEGNLQLALPANVALRLDKVSQTVFYLGSNETKYWWFDLTGDKTALVGSHEKATPEAVASFGLPVHPLDLLEVLAIKPIPDPNAEQATHAMLVWSKDGKYLGLTLPGRWGGERRFWLDPQTFDPVRVELIDKAGVLAVAGALSKYAQVEVASDTTVHPWMATQFDVELPAQQATAVLTLVRPVNPGESQRAKLFDLDGLLKYYKIQKVVDIDQQTRRQAAATEDPAK
jgi:hypothetical protein